MFVGFLLSNQDQAWPSLPFLRLWPWCLCLSCGLSASSSCSLCWAWIQWWETGGFSFKSCDLPTLLINKSWISGFTMSDIFHVCTERLLFKDFSPSLLVFRFGDDNVGGDRLVPGNTAPTRTQRNFPRHLLLSVLPHTDRFHMSGIRRQNNKTFGGTGLRFKFG